MALSDIAKKFIKGRAKKLPPWSAPHILCGVCATTVWASWLFVRDLGFWLNLMPVLRDVLFTIEYWPLISASIGNVLFGVIIWRISLPLLCRSLQLWFPEWLDGYKCESETLAETQ